MNIISLGSVNKIVAGYFLGRWEPTTVVSFQSKLKPEQLYRVLKEIRVSIDVWQPLKIDKTHSQETEQIEIDNALIIGQYCVELIKRFGYPALENVTLLDNKGDTSNFQLLIPSPVNHLNITLHMWKLTIELINAFASAQNNKEFQIIADQLLSPFSSIKGSSFELKFITAAFLAHIPVIHISPKILQFGYSSQSKWLNASFTENTSALSGQLSKDKFRTAQRLKSIGLPVPRQIKILNLLDAKQAAQQIGYPVVLKPLNLAQGVGVVAGIKDEDSLEMAFKQISMLIPPFIVEKHITGKDYRLTVYQGKLIWAIERLPAGVYGDGIHSISELITIENTNQKRSNHPTATLKPIKVDEAVIKFLANKNLDLNSIPERGVYTTLMQAANIAKGGYPVAMYDHVHPDNAELAVSAADALRLDLAGIDLIIPDIRISWREAIAGICEVNAQPGLEDITGPHVYEQILNIYLSGKKRIPIIVVFGEDKDARILKEIISVFENTNQNVGLYHYGRVKLNNKQIGDNNLSFWDGTNALLTNPKVDVCLLSLNDDHFINSGFPFTYFDVGIIAGDNIVTNSNRTPVENTKLFLEYSTGMVNSKIIIVKNSPTCPSYETAVLFSDETTNIVNFDELTTLLRKKLHAV